MHDTLYSATTAAIKLLAATALLASLTACGGDDSGSQSNTGSADVDAELKSETVVPDSQASDALLNLLATVEQIQTDYVNSDKNVLDADTAGEANRLIAHMLYTGMEFWLEADPSNPQFKQYVTTNRKLLGDNPDSIYYFAAIRDDQEYRIRGNIGAAVFTSFTIEGGSQGGHAAKRSISALGDNDMEIDADGSYEIIVSRKKPKQGNWLKLEEGAGQITTRHYHEAKLSVAADPDFGMDIDIEVIGDKTLAPYGGDQAVAARLNWVANFVREHAPIGMTPTNEAMAKALGWISLEPNVFTTPGQWVSASGDMAYGNTHAYYLSSPYELADDEALVITGRFPEARFANVVLWNRYMQSYDFANRQVSLNRQQISYEEDGSFRLIVAHKDPGLPNWLDTEGRSSGQIYWRWVFPRSAPEAPVGEVVKLKSLK